MLKSKIQNLKLGFEILPLGFVVASACLFGEEVLGSPAAQASVSSVSIDVHSSRPAVVATTLLH